MKTLIILLAVIVVFLGFIGMMMCGIFSLLHDLKKLFKKEIDSENEEI